MTHVVLQGFFFVTVFFGVRTIPTCRTVYPDLCAYNKNEVNATEYEDYDEDDNCGRSQECHHQFTCPEAGPSPRRLHLSRPSAVLFCLPVAYYCQQVTFCSVIELSDECNSATVFYNVSNSSASTQLQCDISALDSQANVPVYKILNRTENEFQVNVFSEFDLGRYKIVCEACCADEDRVNSTQWSIVSINPSVVFTDSEEVKLQLTLAGESQINSIVAWCFVQTPDNNIQILSTIWVSDSQIDCLGFSPVVPGVFKISLSSSVTPNTFDQAISLKVTSKQPVAQEAKYSNDFEAIFINFDENIELRSGCENMFPESSEYFGIGFDCHTRGNVLVVKMGSQCKMLRSLMMQPEGKICRAGSQDADLCFLPSVNLPISKPKLSGPNLSFYINAVCSGDATQKYMNVSVMPSKRLNFPFQNPVGRARTSGKTQRRNLIMWRSMRQLQSKLSSHHIVMQMNTTNVEPLLESLSLVDNVLDVDEHLTSTASVSVFIQSSPSSSILAEASVTFCENVIKLFRHKWAVNGRDVSEDGKLLVLKDLPPGKYVIKCTAIDYNSTEILGQGWATTEISTIEERIIIFPTEITIGTADDLILRAVTWHGNSVSWSCRTSVDEDCFARDKKSVTDVINLNSSNISVPAGTLPVGIYIWTAGSGNGSSTARVFIKDGNVAAVGVEISSVFVKPSEDIIVRGTVDRIHRACRAWWSSVRQRGFDYYNLTVGVSVNSSITQPPGKEASLVIPSNSENWKIARSGSSYLFQLQVFCPYSANNEKGSFDYLKLPLVVSRPPRLSPLTVQPLAGEAMITTFSVSGGDADVSVDDYPLMYEWSYVDPCGVEVPINRGAFARDFTTYLPPGDLKLNLKVCNGRKTCSTTSTPTISVIQSSEFPTDKFHNARNQIQHLMTSGDILEAFGLATTVFKSLALLAEGEFREEIYSTVEKGIKNRIDDLTRRVQADPTDGTAFEFFERAVTVAKYFRKESDIMNCLLEFRKNVSSSNRAN